MSFPADLPLLDVQHLRAMTSGDAHLAAEVIDIFRQQAEIWSRLLTVREPAASWADAAHSIKGAALGIGALRLAQMCERAEKLGRSGDASQTAAAVALGDVRDVLALTEEVVARVAHQLAVSEDFSAIRVSNASNS